MAETLFGTFQYVNRQIAEKFGHQKPLWKFPHTLIAPASQFLTFLYLRYILTVTITGALHMTHHTCHAHHHRSREGAERLRGLAGGGRSRRGKLFDSGQFQLILLGLIGDGERHGYELMREIEERTRGIYTPSPGVVYPTLTLLVDMGLIEETAASGTRKTFRITDEGRTLLEERSGQVEMLQTRLDAIGNKAGRADSAPTRRAMANLRHVLMDRLSKPGTTDKHMLEAARMIDEVAGNIERM